MSAPGGGGCLLPGGDGVYPDLPVDRHTLLKILPCPNVAEYGNANSSTFNMQPNFTPVKLFGTFHFELWQYRKIVEF